jgi:general secretion pathway protein C
MIARMMAFLVWGVLACSSGYWLLKLLVQPIATPAQALPASDHSAPRIDLQRLFGAIAPPEAQAEAAPLEGRIKLLGVVAPKDVHARQAGEGVALISVDGVPRTVRVGALVDGELRLLEVRARSVSLGNQGSAAVTIEIAPGTVAATGTLPVAGPSPVVLGGNPPLAPPAGAAPEAPEGRGDQAPTR